MAISPHAFPPRMRRPSAEAFVSPKLISETNLVESLLLLTKEISALQPLQFLLRRNSSSLIRKAKLLAILFEELLRGPAANLFSTSAVLCFEEMFIVLQRIKALLEDCSNGSRMWILMQNNSISNNFHELMADLSTLLDIFPAREIGLSEDVEELVWLVRKQCAETKAFVDPDDENLRREVLNLLDRIKKEIVPDQKNLSEIFSRLGIRDSSTCRDEIESLQDEVQNQTDDKSRSDAIALIGLVRYAKCVLFRASTPRAAEIRRRKSSSEIAFPTDFRCPISLDVMRDPVVVATGQTYDRESIRLWIESGHNTCPKTGQTLAHTELITNRALRNLICMWCREQKIPFDATDSKDRRKGVVSNKTALEATRMTASFLVNKLSISQSTDDTNGVVYELRVLAKADSESRACVAEAGAIPLFVRHLGSEHPNLQVNAVTAILNLSILEANKTLIMETEGALNGVVEVLKNGATWEAKANAAATIFSLSGVPSHRKKLGRKTRVVRGLLELAKEGPTFSKRDALAAILNLAADRDGVLRLVEAGVVETTVQLMDGLPEEAVTIVEVVVKRGGLLAIAAAYGGIKKLGGVLREGSDRARESAVAALVTICRKGGADMVAELVGVAGIERVVWEVMGTGTPRGRRKAATLLRILRRWAAGLDGDHYHLTSYSGHSTTTATTTTVVLPG
ncbi:U-box domain-containing protein 16 [Morus notabilis]|uniref:RING-type E3 ubiquitin transferase n=1 Tax=Morus notabilis TaxID=981085 RepID=W9QXE8_9ROSA|nr:U-box domain-containing protein 16 [Morus notabilis]EXB42364.1 U-box domain-containing protein 16 [Morus notabilis]